MVAPFQTADVRADHPAHSVQDKSKSEKGAR